METDLQVRKNRGSQTTTTPRDIIIKMAKVKENLKATRENQESYKKEHPIRLSGDFSA